VERSISAQQSQTNKFKVIFFDLGNVLVTVYQERAISRLALLLKTTEQAIRTMWLDKLNYFAEYERGLVTSQQLYEQLFANSVGIGMEEFYSAYTAIFELNQDVARLATALAKNYRLSIISNTNQLHFDKIKSDYRDIMALFTKPVLSFEAHLQKPDAEIYLYALEKLECAPEHALFVDDKKENVAAASEVGIRSIQYVSKEDLHKEFNKLGII